MATYSFIDNYAAISGPGGSFSIGSGAGNSEEGITVEMAEDKGTMTTGADGQVMHSLHAGKSGTATIRLLKTSPTNALLMAMYNFQSLTSANFGRNTITVTDAVRGDTITLSNVAFRRAPTITYAKEGGINEWSFNAGQVDHHLGTGEIAV